MHSPFVVRRSSNRQVYKSDRIAIWRANLIGRAVAGGLDRYLEACAAEPESEELPLADLAERTGYAAPHLGWLVRQGRLAAVKRGGRWYSTVAAVERYRADVERGEVKRGRPKSER